MEKFIQYLGFGVFTIFAGLQYNDPDPIKWIIVYGSSAMYSFKVIKIKNYKIFNIDKEFNYIMGLYIFILLFIIIKEIQFNFLNISIEHVFEISGLFICITWLIYLKRVASKG
jgi:hypothetical protein